MEYYSMLKTLLLSEFLFTSFLTIPSPANAMENDGIEETSPSGSIKRSAVENVTFKKGYLSLTGKQLESCLDIDSLETNVGTFSVSSQKLLNKNCSDVRKVSPFSDFRSLELDGEFKFEISIVDVIPQDPFMTLCPYAITLKREKD